MLPYKYIIIISLLINLKACTPEGMFSKSTDQELVEAGSENTSDDFKALEPVSVSGAFLACQYLPDQQQNSDQIFIECQLVNVPELSPSRVEASFYKIDDEEATYPLQIQNQNIEAFSWLIAESPQTRELNRIIAHISIEGSDPYSFNTTIELIPNLAPKQELFLEASENGLLGGHFDIDTSSQIYPAFEGATDGHVHEYDKRYQVNGADFLSLQDSRLRAVQDVVGPDQVFSLVVLNGQLSPLARLGINDDSILAANYSNVEALKTVYSITGQVPGTVPLEKLIIAFPKDILLHHGLAATAPSCVRLNQTSADGHYRNGALVLQAVDPSRYAKDPVTGWTTAGLLWEATLFWHRDNTCS